MEARSKVSLQDLLEKLPVQEGLALEVVDIFFKEAKADPGKYPEAEEALEAWQADRSFFEEEAIMVATLVTKYILLAALSDASTDLSPKSLREKLAAKPEYRGLTRLVAGRMVNAAFMEVVEKFGPGRTVFEHRMKLLTSF